MVTRQIVLELTDDEVDKVVAQISSRIQYFEKEAEQCGNINRIMECIPMIETLKKVQSKLLEAI